MMMLLEQSPLKNFKLRKKRTRRECALLCKRRIIRGLEKEEKVAELPRMSEGQAREITKRMRAEAAEEAGGEEEDKMHGLGFKL